MKKLIIILSVLFLILTSCDTTDPKPPEEKPPGYQEDIPWPSLADSPWPMNHGNPQSTGRSKYYGPTQGVIDWSLDSTYMMASLATGLDSNIIFMELINSYGLYSITPKGETLWKIAEGISINSRHSSPLIAKDGTIYITGGWSGELYAIDVDGTLKWKYNIHDLIRTIGINIGLDGTIYFLADDKNLYALTPNGTLKWKYFHEDFESRSTVISFSPNGKTLYIPGTTKTVYAFDIDNQNIKWSFGDGRSGAAPMVDSQGNIYLLTVEQGSYSGKPSLFSLYEDGNVRWVFEHDNQQQKEVYSYAEGTIDKYGNIYFALDTLYSVDYSGNLRWKKDLDGYTWTPLICDANDNIYTVIIHKNGDAIREIGAFYMQGNKVWSIPIDEWARGGFSPIIAFNKLIIPTNKSNNLYFIK